MITVVAMFGFSWGLVFLITPLVVRLAHTLALFDIPSERKIHREPTPRLGGIALFSAFFLPFLGFYVRFCSSLHLSLDHILLKPEWLGIVIGGVIIFSVGILDDIRGVSPSFKFLAQCTSAIAAFSGGLTVGDLSLPFGNVLSLPFSLSLTLTLLWFVLIINGFNLIDGMDGLAAGTAFIAAFFLLIICFQYERYYMALPTVMVAGATLGFLHYNLNPARIFMGDSGSYFLGYTLAAIALKVSRDERGTTNLLVPALILLLPITDALMAAIRRGLRGMHIFRADKEHIHHCVLRQGFSQKHTVFCLYAVTFVAGTVATVVSCTPPLIAAVLVILTLSTFLFLAHTVGYLACVTETPPIRSFTGLLRYAGLLSSLEIRCWALKRATTTLELRHTLSQLFSYMELDYAQLTIFSPPLTISTPRGERSPDNQRSSLRHSALPLHISLPLAEERHQHGYLIVEKAVGEGTLPVKILLLYLERITRLTLACVKKQSRFAESRETIHPRKQTYTLIARMPYPGG